MRLRPILDPRDAISTAPLGLPPTITHWLQNNRKRIIGSSAPGHK
jgi:hypothetical protein